MKDIIKKSALLGLIGVPVFIISCTLSMGIVDGMTKLVTKHK